MTTAKEKAEEICEISDTEEMYINTIPRIDRVLIETICEGFRIAAGIAERCGVYADGHICAANIRQRADEIEKSIGGNVAVERGESK